MSMDTTNHLLTSENLVKHFDISGGLLDQLSFKKDVSKTKAYRCQGGQ